MQVYSFVPHHTRTKEISTVSEFRSNKNLLVLPSKLSLLPKSKLALVIFSFDQQGQVSKGWELKKLNFMKKNKKSTLESHTNENDNCESNNIINSKSTLTLTEEADVSLESSHLMRRYENRALLMKNALASKNEELFKIKNRVAILQDVVVSLNNTKTEYHTRSKQIQLKLKESKNEIQSLHKKIGSLEDDILKQGRSISQYRKQLLEKEQDCYHLNVKLEEQQKVIIAQNGMMENMSLNCTNQNNENEPNTIVISLSDLETSKKNEEKLQNRLEILQHELQTALFEKNEAEQQRNTANDALLELKEQFKVNDNSNKAKLNESKKLIEQMQLKLDESNKELTSMYQEREETNRMLRNERQQNISYRQESEKQKQLDENSSTNNATGDLSASAQDLNSDNESSENSIKNADDRKKTKRGRLRKILNKIKSSRLWIF